MFRRSAGEGLQYLQGKHVWIGSRAKGKKTVRKVRAQDKEMWLPPSNFKPLVNRS